MELLSSFTLNPLRIYTVPKRIKNKKGIATFPAKHISSHLDYSVDFSNQCDDGEKIIQGKIICNHTGLKINTSSFNNHSLTAFLSEGKENLSFFLTFIVKTNRGNECYQEIILPTYGCFLNEAPNIEYKVLSLDEGITIPDYKPPLNALIINGAYLINKKNSYIMV